MNDLKKPLVSILLPVHNAEKYLASCVESLFTQSYSNIEIIAIDDKSCDKSLRVLRGLKKKDKRLRVYSNVKRYGLSLTLNRAMKRAKGQFVTIMNTEDTSISTRISKQIKFLTTHKEVVAVGTQCQFINNEGKKLAKSNFPAQNHNIYASPLHGISMQFETVLINRMLLPKDIIKFKSNLFPFIYSDLMIKILPYGKFANLNEFLHYHRNHPGAYFIDLKQNISSLFKLWLKSLTFYNYTLNRTFFFPLIKLR
ncbi:MAG: glycosyltransferase family A protein [Candidatus Levyibacteriota bacterium]